MAKTKPPEERPSIIVLEDLHIQGMLKNRKLSRAINDIGLGEFKRQLTYKAMQAGIEVKQVARWYPSSKTCYSCGNVKKELGLEERMYVCEECGYIADRDYNAAKVLAASAS